jgi:hypothetical protein
MDVDDFFRTENLAVEARDAVLAVHDDWQKFSLNEPVDFARDWSFGHVDDIGWADEVTNTATRAPVEIDGFNHDATKKS